MSLLREGRRLRSGPGWILTGRREKKETALPPSRREGKKRKNITGGKGGGPPSNASLLPKSRKKEENLQIQGEETRHRKRVHVHQQSPPKSGKGMKGAGSNVTHSYHLSGGGKGGKKTPPS